MKYIFLLLLFASISWMAAGACSDDSESSDTDSDGDADTDTDSDTDADSDTDSDTDTDTDADSDTGTDTDTDTDSDVDAVYPWHTFYPGEAYAIALCDDGGLVVVGASDESWSGPSGQEPLSGFVSYFDLTVLKLSPAGEYQWHTFIGDTGPEYGHSAVLSAQGNILIGGQAGASFDGPGGETAIHGYNGDYDNFILALDSGGQYLWHTFLGASDSEDRASIAVDSEGNILVSGTSTSSWAFEGFPGALIDHSLLEGSADVYVAKFTSDGEYLWHTFLGGDGEAHMEALGVDAAGSAYVAGVWYGLVGQDWLGPEQQPPVNPKAGDTDGFLVKLSGDGTYQWHTYFGGRQADIATGVVANQDYGVFVTGSSEWPWNGSGGEAPIAAHTKTTDAFVMRFDLNGNYLWHSFFGGGDLDEGSDVVLGDGGGLYVVGSAAGSWNGPAGETPLTSYAAAKDAFVMKMGLSGAFKWHAFLGGEGDDTGLGLTVSSEGEVFLAGTSATPWDGPSGEPPLNPHSGGRVDQFVYAQTDPDGSSDADTDTDTDAGVNISGWECHPAFFGANDGCDCGCGVDDPDCDGDGCNTGGCFDSACLNCHWGGVTIPCVSADQDNQCPTGPLGLYGFDGDVLCTPLEACLVPAEEGYIGAELQYECPNSGDVCCVQFCPS